MIPPWTAYAPPSDRVQRQSHAFTAETGSICQGRGVRCNMLRKKAQSLPGSPPLKPSLVMKVTAVRAQRIHLGVPDASGRQTPEPIAGSSFKTDADIAIKALGFDPEDLLPCLTHPSFK